MIILIKKLNPNIVIHGYNVELNYIGDWDYEIYTLNICVDISNQFTTDIRCDTFKQFCKDQCLTLVVNNSEYKNEIMHDENYYEINFYKKIFNNLFNECIYNDGNFKVIFIETKTLCHMLYTAASYFGVNKYSSISSRFCTKSFSCSLCCLYSSVNPCLLL